MVDLSIDIWSDIACPWCYIGKRRLERALAMLPAQVDARITWHAFELNPSAPRQAAEGSYTERLAKKYGVSARDAQTMIDRVAAAASTEGLKLNFDMIRPSNTFDAHRLLRLAQTQDRQGAVKERFMHGYFCEGQLMSDPETLIRLSVEAGLGSATVRHVLDGNSYASEVRHDEVLARELDIDSVPFFILNERYGVAGAQPPEVLLEVIEQLQRAGAHEQEPLEGASCEPGAC